MYDALFLTPAPETPLTRNQTVALREWVLRGGTLIVDASERTDGLIEDGFADLLPFVPTGSEQVKLDLFDEPVVIANGEALGSVLVSSNDRPLVARRNFGLGSIVCFAVDPASPEFTKWDGARAMWLDVLGALELERGLPKETLPDELLNDRKRALTERVAAKRQSGLRLGLVVLLTALYALAAGPGDYYLVKRLGRPRLTWVTFPAIVLVFTFAAWFGAEAWIGGEMAASGLQRTLVFSDERVAVNYHLATLFAPRTEDYRLQHGRDVLTAAVRTQFGDDAPLHFDHDEGTLVQRIPSWQEHVFAASETVGEYPDVTVRLLDEGGTRVAEIVNSSDVRLGTLTLIFGNQMWRGPAFLEPGDTHRLLLDPAASNVLRLRSAPYDFLLPPAEHTRKTFWAHARQLDARDALRRGALILLVDAAGEAPLELTVNGTRRPEKANRILSIVTYPGESEP
jgi:hypothetical protein